jgi:hypothetical protein
MKQRAVVGEAGSCVQPRRLLMPRCFRDRLPRYQGFERLPTVLHTETRVQAKWHTYNGRAILAKSLLVMGRPVGQSGELSLILPTPIHFHKRHHRLVGARELRI